MSVKIMGMVFDHYPGGGGEFALALAIADHAHDDGGSIFPSIPSLARKSRQGERSVQYQLRKMEEVGWLQCVEKSSGGRNRSSRYRINPGWVQDPDGFEWKAVNGAKIAPLDDAKPRNFCTVSPPETVQSTTLNGAKALHRHITVKNRQLTSDPPDFFEAGAAEPHGPGATSDDRKTGEWMLKRLRQINPGHRDPNWRRWCREIRLMRERDRRTHREICELFAWANADAFWQKNILSPGKLRERWDQLLIARKTAGGAGRVPPPAVAGRDWKCHCGAGAIVMNREGVGLCAKHREIT